MVIQFLWYLLGVLSLESRCIRSPTTLRPVCCQGAKPHGKTMCPGSCGSSILSQARHTADTSEQMSARLQPSDIQFCLRIHVFPAESQTLRSASHQTCRIHVLSKKPFILAALGIGSRASCMRGKHSATELCLHLK